MVVLVVVGRVAVVGGCVWPVFVRLVGSTVVVVLRCYFVVWPPLGLF